MANANEYDEREVTRSGARDVLDLIRQHAGIRQDGYIYPCEAVFDGTRVECIGYGPPPLDDSWEERPTTFLAIVVDDDLAEHIQPLFPEIEEAEELAELGDGIVDAEIVDEPLELPLQGGGSA